MKFSTGEQLIDICQSNQLAIWQVMLTRECQLSERTEAQVIAGVEDAIATMFAAIDRGIDNQERSLGGLIGGEAHLLYQQLGQANACYLSDDMLRIVSYSMAVMEVNAQMGVIVAAPTAGSSGVLAATLRYVADQMDVPMVELVRAFLTAGAVGLLFTLNATVSGAEGGCQAEIGTATAMAAAAMAYLKQGSPATSLHAASFAIKNIMGLVCDPIAGLVEVPCTKRNGLAVLNAMLSCDFALLGMPSVVPFDEVVQAMYTVGKAMPATLRETALGGIAACPTAKRLEAKIFSKEL